MEKVTYPQQWDLDVFFNGGSSSPELKKHLEEYTQKTKAFEKNVKNFETPRSNTDDGLSNQLRHFFPKRFVCCFPPQYFSWSMID